MTMTATPPPVPQASPSIARAVGGSVRRSPFLWMGGMVVGGTILLLFVIFGLWVAYNAGAARRVSPSTGLAVPSAFTAAPLPVVPIKVGVRKAGFGDGFVVTFVNDGERYLKFTVTLRRTTLNQESAFEVRLDPAKSTEVGWNEGHTFYPGDTVIITHPDFSKRELIVDPNAQNGFRLVTGKL